MKYSIEELKKLAAIRHLGFKDHTLDDIYTNEALQFKSNTHLFFLWIEKMERAGKIESLLEQEIIQ